MEIKTKLFMEIYSLNFSSMSLTPVVELHYR